MEKLNVGGLQKMPRSPEEIPSILFELTSKQCGKGSEDEIVLREGGDGSRRYVLRPLNIKGKEGDYAHLMLVTGVALGEKAPRNELRLYDHQPLAIAKTAIAYIVGCREVESPLPVDRRQFCRTVFGDPGLQLNGNPMAALAMMLMCAAVELARPFPEFIQKSANPT